MSIVDPVFNQIPKNKSALCIWRVENMQLKSVPKDSFGTFFKGDTYIVYNAQEVKSVITEQHIHLWIGSESTKDEQGVGAFKMVELDEHLGGAPIQHRECEGFETDRFINYFKPNGGIKYQNGGAASGFHHYEKRTDPHLYQCKGKRHVRLNECPVIDWTVMNRADSFIIDLNSVIFVWNGKSANKIERIQAMNKAKDFRDERNDNCNIVVVEDGEEKDLGKDELKLFETRLPLKDKMAKIKNSDTNADDLKFEREVASYIKLYKCSDAVDEDGTLKIKIIEQKTGPLVKEDLNSDDSFIVDNGRAGIWVWIGKKSSQKERQEAMRNALGFLQAKGFEEKIQNTIKVTRVIDGSEPTEFKALFNKWSEQHEQKGLGKAHTINNVAKIVQTKFDTSQLHSNSHLASETQMIDDGKGIKEIYYVQNFDIHKLPESQYGQFHSGDCYIIHYKYKHEAKENHILYYWIGRKSSKDEQGTAALKTIELDNSLNGSALQVRVNENKESNHFMLIFGGKIIIYQGGKASGFRNSSGDDTDKLGDKIMLQVRSFGPFNAKAVQVDFSASSLNSNDVFIVLTKTSTHCWFGKGSTGDERELAKVVCNELFKREPTSVFESQEKDDFWNTVGGKQPYSNDKRLQMQTAGTQAARLFEISNATGKINVQEIFQFTQDDLNSNDVMLLDAWENIFLWFGSGANKQEIDESETVAYDYLRTDPSNRGTDLPVFKVRQGQEPPNFTGFFGFWDPNAFHLNVEYSALKAELQSKNQQHLFIEAVKLTPKSVPSSIAAAAVNGSDAKTVDMSKYSYEELTKPIDQLPEGVDAANRELYLNDEDFLKVFKMTYSDFASKPAWKQKDLKRAARLF